ncbi:hypothetical protein BTH42_31960 [Burkholderia sp. SRS-W-2-2016]|nr:hypothetical protein BTH42_31960 [Burkholderia sp. SRS-W-2-2016]
MVSAIPVVNDATRHRPLSNGETLQASVIQLSGDAGNAVQLGADGGLFASSGKPGRYAMTITDRDFQQSDWISAGSPSSWNIGATQLVIPDTLLNIVCLCFVNVSVSPVSSSALTYYDSTLTGGQSQPLFMLTGSPAGRLTVRPDSNVPVPSWGIYLVNPLRAQLPPGSTLSLGRTLNGVNYTASNGIIRVYEHLTLVPLN